MKPTDTKQKIMDTAEHLFARDGYRGTSLRAITGKAGVNLAAVNYHFGSKTSLLETVIRRRILPLNQIRKKRLKQLRENARKKKKTPDIKDVLTAFIEPTLLFMESSPGAKNFIAFIGRSFTGPDDTVRKVFMRFIKPMFYLLFEAACDSLPNQPQETIFWRLHFTMGALFHTMQLSGNVDIGPKNLHADINAKSLINHIIPYITAGMKAR